MYIKLIGLGMMVALIGCHDVKAAEAVPANAPANVVSCGRECLEHTIENYLQALAAQDLSRIRVTDDVVFSENNQVLELGDGSWQTMTGTGTYRHYFADPQAGQVAVISTMRENGQGVIYDLRLRLRGDRIAEIESMVIRTPAGAAQYEKLGAPPPNFRDIIPAAQRNTREEMLAIPYQYLKGMENNDPNGDYSFFDKDCNRYEHAVKTTNSEPKHVGHTTNTTFSTMTCEAQFSNGGLAFVTRIRDERYNTNMVVDEEKQAIFGFVFLDHNGTVRKITRADGTSYVMPSYFSTPRGLNVGEAWRVRNKKLFEIEMTLTEVPYGMRPQFHLNDTDNDWLVSRNVNSGDIHVASNCDRRCLQSVTDNFLKALVAHDYSKLPLSPEVQYRENGQDLALGDGLWGTATGINDYRVYINNPETGEAGFFGTITETDIPGLLSARLQIRDGLIEDINVTVMRHEYSGERGGTVSLFYPQLDSMFDPGKFTAMEPALSQPGKARFDDLVQQVASLISNSRDSVTLAADAANGLVLQQSISDITNASSQQRDGHSSGSYSVLTSTLYKFNGSKLLLMKSVSRPVPYRMPL